MDYLRLVSLVAYFSSLSWISQISVLHNQSLFRIVRNSESFLATKIVTVTYLLKLLSENKHIICSLKIYIIRFQEKNLNLNRDSNLESLVWRTTNWAILAQSPRSNVPLENTETRDLKVRGSNPGSGSKFSL